MHCYTVAPTVDVFSLVANKESSTKKRVEKQRLITALKPLVTIAVMQCFQGEQT